MTLINAVSKLTRRKKRNGYYEASELLTPQEKQSLVIASCVALIPALVTTLLLVIN